ncbi:MAG: hypothetical protein K2Q28_16730 [Hyphomicrobium sp.]|nr:hypothetical protein [Hyphomicrobium sp.]
MPVRRSSTGATDDEDILSRPAHLYAAGRWRALTAVAEPEGIPPPPDGTHWIYEGCVALGVQRVELPGTEPEPAITGLVARGYYVWQISTDEAAAL